MEKEIAELRAQLAAHQASPTSEALTVKGSTENYGAPSYRIAPHHDTESGAAVASLMELAAGAEAGSYMRSPNAQVLLNKRLGDVVLTAEEIQDLFRVFFESYHPFVPLLDPLKPPDEYYQNSKLLFWVVISVAARRYAPKKTLLSTLAKPVAELLWSSVSEIPQNHSVVKALCLLCTWPFPVSSTSMDPTFMLCGLAIQISMQIGLHRPSHTSDFTRFKVALREEELRDRLRTWAAANAVAQRVSTLYGQPPSTMYDWTLIPVGNTEPGFVLPQDTAQRLLIERFSNRVTEALYMDTSDPVGLVCDESRQSLTKILLEEYRQLESEIAGDDGFLVAYLRAAGLHLHLSTFFDSPTSKDYSANLLTLYTAASTFIRAVLDLQGPSGSMLVYSTNYILQMMIAAAFTLLKLLSSSFANYVNLEQGKSLFTKTIWAIRSISVQENDLPSRFGEVLAQFWRASGAGAKTAYDPSEAASSSLSSSSESSLQLKVKCRMSMSLVYDSAWRWREEFQARSSLESAVKNPTLPDSTADSSATSNAGDHQGLVPQIGPASSSNLLDDSITAPMGGFGDGYNEVFDPLNWIFDGDIDFPKFDLDDIGMGGQGLSLP